MNKRSAWTLGAIASLAPVLLSAAPAGPGATVLAPPPTNAAAAPPPAGGTNEVHQPGDIAARVNGRELAWAALDAAAHNLLKADIEARFITVPAGHEDEALQFYRRKAATTFLNRVLLYDEARRRGVAISPEDRSNAVCRVEAQLQPRGYRSLDDFFSRSPQGPEMRRDFEENLYSEKLLDEAVRSRIHVEEADREAYVRELSARRAEGKKKIDALRARVLEGADFAAVARESSEHSSRPTGGDLGEFALGQLDDAALDAAAFRQPTNAVGPVVETKLGFAVIQVTARTPPQPSVGDTPARPGMARARMILVRVPPVLTAVEIDRALKRRKYESAFKVLVRGLRRQAKIETIYPEIR